MPAGPEEGLEKSATLLIALGEDHAAEVLKLLGPREVQKLGHAMAGLRTVPRTTVETVLDEFHKHAEEKASMHVDTDNYIRSVLTKALGDDKASNLISRILQGGETSGIEGLKWMDAQTVADLIKNEHLRSLPPSWCTSNTTTPAKSSTTFPSACVTMSCCASPRWKASSRRR